MIQTWLLQDRRQSLVLAAEREQLPEVIYWGPRLPDGEDLNALAQAHQMDVTGGMLDQNPELSICPEASRSFPGQPGLILRAGDGTPLLPNFRFENASEKENSLTFSYRDQANTLTYRAHFTIHPVSHMITARAEIDADAPVHLHWLSAPVFPAPQNSNEVIDFSGRWCGEFQINHTPWSAGMRDRENRTGRTGHEHFPGLIVPCKGATNTRGHAYGFHYGWSGGHRMIAEELPDGRRQIQFGNATMTEHAPQRKFTSAPLYAIFSDDGINGCAVGFQRHLRDGILRFPNPDRPRPVHYNCWEAVYFNHTLPELKEIAERAAALGAERFVLDDGWFGKRDDDTRSLSDWEVDRRKYPDGLGPLIDHVQGLGMSFGIWFEPEMINPDSDTYRAHPDWVLGDVDQILGRHQMVLNMALPEVQDFLVERISAVLSEYEIDYIKWDHNRVLPIPDAAQARGSYALIDRLRAAFPHVEIESCSSGGGRIDFGILERTHRVWLSDSNDALERLRIQHNAAIFLPMVVTGSHVGPRHCHTSGRVIDIRMRAWVAAQRHMGFEMDPRELTEDEVEVLTRTTTWWKSNRDWMAQADILRLDSADPSLIAEQHLAQEGNKFVVFAGITDTSRQITPRPLPLTRLSPGARYRIELVNRHDAPALSRGDPALKTGPLELSGQYLMNHGLMLPWQFPLNMWVIEGTKL
ncbi:alpha-galactosidase [Aliiroseovarius sp. KMU-50]|uniref:alpha-galactosidase n=1 Tax=Aliiroseovarius salicola TaxID=3009082 RepID=A0ABT4W2N8_9RHOB|nr:alpha-galactosidase [Aliiroseovarius sp. KMU-50]MDA5094746.1 alpha-galactosidase [Aliiroseovarius sp. KMU-50]